MKLKGMKMLPTVNRMLSKGKQLFQKNQRVFIGLALTVLLAGVAVYLFQMTGGREPLTGPQIAKAAAAKAAAQAKIDAEAAKKVAIKAQLQKKNDEFRAAALATAAATPAAVAAKAAADAKTAADATAAAAAQAKSGADAAAAQQAFERNRASQTTPPFPKPAPIAFANWSKAVDDLTDAAIAAKKNDNEYGVRTVDTGPGTISGRVLNDGGVSRPIMVTQAVKDSNTARIVNYQNALKTPGSPEWQERRDFLLAAGVLPKNIKDDRISTVDGEWDSRPNFGQIYNNAQAAYDSSHPDAQAEAYLFATFVPVWDGSVPGV